jgi:S-adenosylmethionine:tRNA ribosyltransferase-isomerase
MYEAVVNAVAPSGSTRLADYDYALPTELVAQTPTAERDAARLMVLDRDGGPLCHAVVRELPTLLRAGDLLVFNDARVRAARLRCRSLNGAAVELLVVSEQAPQVWSCLGRPAKRLRAGSRLSLPDDGAATVHDRTAPGRYAIAFDQAVDVPTLLARHGELPVPPYIKRPYGASPLDRERYQTVFAAHDGAVAAPTAGLHFTPALLAALDAAGVQRAALTLVVGPATFLPVRSADVRDHRMEPEWAEVPAATIAAIERTKASGGRVIAVGTTTARALESGVANAIGAKRSPPPHDARTAYWADAFILPGFRFQIVDGLLTNFHLPRSTLLMLVSAFAGRGRVLEAYAVAVRERYRFYSYGDAMLIR